MKGTRTNFGFKSDTQMNIWSRYRYLHCTPLLPLLPTLFECLWLISCCIHIFNSSNVFRRECFYLPYFLFLYHQRLTRALCCPRSKTIKYKDEWNPTTSKTFQSNRLLTLSLCQHDTALNSTIQFNSVLFMCAFITRYHHWTTIHLGLFFQKHNTA